MEQKRYTTPRTRADWRKWLTNNSDETRVRVIRYKKHTGKSSPIYQDLLDEAICFGWIDTTVRRLDDERYTTDFMKRTKKSTWSNNTQKYARRLIEEGLMTAAGLSSYEAGLKKPTHDLNRKKNPETPKELLEELNKNKKALTNFNNFAPSYKRQYIYWIDRAKLPETKRKRVKHIFQNALENKKTIV